MVGEKSLYVWDNVIAKEEASQTRGACVSGAKPCQVQGNELMNVSQVQLKQGDDLTPVIQLGVGPRSEGNADVVVKCSLEVKPPRQPQ